MDRQLDPVGQMHVDSAARLSIAMDLSFTICFIGVMFVLGVPLNNNYTFWTLHNEMVHLIFLPMSYINEQLSHSVEVGFLRTSRSFYHWQLRSSYFWWLEATPMVVKFWNPCHEPLWSREVKHALVWNYILCSVLCLVSLNMLSKSTHCMSQARFLGLEFIFLEILGQFKPSKWPRFPRTDKSVEKVVI